MEPQCYPEGDTSSWVILTAWTRPARREAPDPPASRVVRLGHPGMRQLRLESDFCVGGNIAKHEYHWYKDVKSGSAMSYSHRGRSCWVRPCALKWCWPGIVRVPAGGKKCLVMRRAMTGFRIMYRYDSCTGTLAPHGSEPSIGQPSAAKPRVHTQGFF